MPTSDNNNCNPSLPDEALPKIITGKIDLDSWRGKLRQRPAVVGRNIFLT